MLEAFEVHKNVDTSGIPTLTLKFEERQKSRYKTKTDCGQDIGWFIDRGIVLEDGDCLKCSDGQFICVRSASESVSQIESTNQLLLTRGAYHLGNRHVPLQVGDGFLRYQHDHVLDDMVRGLGMTVECKELPFQPENGAYHGHSSSHSHGHSHSHE